MEPSRPRWLRLRPTFRPRPTLRLLMPHRPTIVGRLVRRRGASCRRPRASCRKSTSRILRSRGRSAEQWVRHQRRGEQRYVCLSDALQSGPVADHARLQHALLGWPGLDTRSDDRPTGRTYDAYLGAAWRPQFSPRFGADLAVSAGVYSDFQVVNLGQRPCAGSCPGNVHAFAAMEV